MVVVLSEWIMERGCMINRLGVACWRSMSEKYYRHSIYSFAINNPLRFIDPNGNEIKPVGTADEVKRINSALAIVEKTNPEIYKALKESKSVFSVSIP
jgi:hypothetical protein